MNQSEATAKIVENIKGIITGYKTWPKYKAGIPFQLLTHELRSMNWKSSFRAEEFRKFLTSNGFTVTNIVSKTGRFMGTRINFTEEK